MDGNCTCSTKITRCVSIIHIIVTHRVHVNLINQKIILYSNIYIYCPACTFHICAYFPAMVSSSSWLPSSIILEKAHIQVSTMWIPCEKAVSTERRIKAIEKLYAEGFDVAVRLSPYVPQFVDFERLNSIKCNKIIIEFLRVNHWIKK